MRVIFLLLIITSCYQDKPPREVVIFKSCDDCDNILIGETYKICSYSKNPFEGSSIQEVVILDKMKGYVKYCKLDDYMNKKEPVWFSRTCKRFIEHIEECQS